MNTIAASLLCWLLAFVQVGILFVFKKKFLRRIENGVLQYLLGMLLAYGLLCLLYYSSYVSDILRITLREGRIMVLWGSKNFGVFMVTIPAIYSAFLIGKGYFGEGGTEASWKWKLKMMISMLLNGFAALFILLNVNLLLNGFEIGELAEMVKKSFQYIDWRWLLAFTVGCALFAFALWLDHKKKR